jgi:hypothetical protein
LLFSLAGCGEVVPVDNGAAIDGGSEIDAGTNGGPCDGASIAIEDLANCVVAAQCEFFVTCEGVADTVEECIENFGGELEGDFQRTLDAVAAGRTTYDGAAAATCLAGFEDLACNEEPGQDCDDVFVGTAADGLQCYIDDECSGLDADCDSGNCDDQCCLGVCVDNAAIGQDCTQRNCVRGARCDSSNGNNTCVSTAEGSSCDFDFHCDDNLFCGPGNICVEALAINLPCVRDSQCEDPMTCIGEQDGGAGGPTMPGTCRFVDTVGAPCDNFCRNDLFCQQPESGGQALCAEKLPIGGSCRDNNECHNGLACRPNDQTCQPEPSLGMPCQPGDCAQGLFCTAELPDGGSTGICAEPVVTGLACDRDSHCETNICGGSQVCEDYVSCY